MIVNGHDLQPVVNTNLTNLFQCARCSQIYSYSAIVSPSAHVNLIVCPGGRKCQYTGCQIETAGHHWGWRPTTLEYVCVACSYVCKNGASVASYPACVPAALTPAQPSPPQTALPTAQIQQAAVQAVIRGYNTYRVRDTQPSTPALGQKPSSRECRTCLAELSSYLDSPKFKGDDPRQCSKCQDKFRGMTHEYV